MILRLVWFLFIACFPVWFGIIGCIVCLIKEKINDVGRRTTGC